MESPHAPDTGAPTDREERTSSQGTAFDRDTLLDLIRSDPGRDRSPAEIAEALRVTIPAILDTADPEDWEQVALDLFDAAPAPALRDDAKARSRRKTAARIMLAVKELSHEQPSKRIRPLGVAARAKVALKTIYQQFGDTPGMLAAVNANRALSLPALWADCSCRDGASAREQIVTMANEYLCLSLEHPQAFRAIVFPRDPGSTATSRELSDALAQRIADQNRLLVRAIALGAQDGSISPVHAEEATRILWAAWNGVASLAWRPDALRADDQKLRQLLMSATDAILRGLPTAPVQPPGGPA